MLTDWNIKIWEYDFLAPYWLLLLLVLPFVYWLLRKQESLRTGEFKFSKLESNQKNLQVNWIPRWRKTSILLYTLVVGFFILPLAKPYNYKLDKGDLDDSNKGIDIVLAMDVSISMYAKDFEPNRLEVSKKLAKEFIDGRKGDRIGLVIYSGEAYTSCPSTLDYRILKNQIDLASGEQLVQGTAIGTGLGTAVSRLRDDSLASKVVILMTDGSNNSGDISPLMAAELAAAKNIRVYTIGVGSNGMALTPIPTQFGVVYQDIPVQIDEEVLQEIANKTDGKYFRATDEKSLKQIYKDIELLEKRRMTDASFDVEPPITAQAFWNWGLLLLLLTVSINRYLFKDNG